MLDTGTVRVAQPGADGWIVNEWLKKAVLLSFRTRENRNINAGFTRFYDKVDLKYSDYSDQDFQRDQVRVVPHALVRRGAYVAPDVVLMPCYVNIGAHVGSGTMIDTWATVGSCAQIGSNVHISGGAGIGGVLEPLQASPTIIEDNCFIGARSEVVEGVIVEHGAVISMGVFLGQSTRIYDRENDRGALRTRTRRRGGGARLSARRQWPLQPGLCGYRQASGRENPGQGRNQRIVTPGNQRYSLGKPLIYSGMKQIGNEKSRIQTPIGCTLSRSSRRLATQKLDFLAARIGFMN